MLRDERDLCAIWRKMGVLERGVIGVLCACCFKGSVLVRKKTSCVLTTSC